MATTSSSPLTRQFSTFRVGDLYLGVEVLKVQELIRGQQMTRVPLAPPIVRGLINLRGQIVTAIDLRVRFGLPPRQDAGDVMNVVIRTDETAVSLLVDEIGDVVEASDDQFEAPPHTMSGALGTLVVGVYKLTTGLLLVIDPAAAVAVGASAETLVA